MYASNMENAEKRFLGKVIYCISTKKHILRYMLVGCSRRIARSNGMPVRSGQTEGRTGMKLAEIG